ncbi:multicopper oxidase family protein [Thermoleophilia bacterium SCSIO 60948]|nr:multicopper oxidase family protein [Thermoleophilia bacterium SCSIO 60948]
MAGASGAGAIAIGAYGITRAASDESFAAGSFAGEDSSFAGARGGPVNYVLRPAPASVDLGARSVETWSYGNGPVGPELRLKQGRRARIRVENRLPEPTSVHWHGIRLQNRMDGVPELTQAAIEPGESFIYEFTPPDAGTYFYHSHVGTQLDRGLLGPLVVEPADERLGYDREAILMLDDWLDGVDGASPDAVLSGLRESGMTMDMGDVKAPMSTSGGLARRLAAGRIDSGDVPHPLFLINGRTASFAPSVEAKPGDRVRLRLVNGAADTIFAVYVEEHDMTVTHADALEVEPQRTEALLLGMGERYDVLVDVRRSTRIVAVPLGKQGQPGVASLGPRRSARGARWVEMTKGWTLPARVLDPRMLIPAEDYRGGASSDLPVKLGMAAEGYAWTLNDESAPGIPPLEAERNEKLRVTFENTTMMPHPMHLHGHSFKLLGPNRRGAIKDTVLVAPMETVSVEFLADNPGRWAMHCHNVYHMEAGMMAELRVS